MADSNWGLNNYDEKITVNFCTTKMERSGIMEEKKMENSIKGLPADPSF